MNSNKEKNKTARLSIGKVRSWWKIKSLVVFCSIAFIGFLCFAETASQFFQRIDDTPEDQNTNDYASNSEAGNDSCADFPSKLAECQPYECSFRHPFTGETMKRKIRGLKNNRCHYVEEMPNNGKMRCKFAVDSLTELAQYYRKEAKKTDSGSFSFSTGSQTTNPLQKCLNDGDCVVSGYE
ncbi:MAG: hypothetical protein GY858_06225 [Candidatus Omnitrophica bacterium]|nr:hypothetical protein [Candidatus Omnitrophota bacterium]